MDTPTRKRVSYFYDPDVGCYSYGLTHLMKPHRMRITHELVTAYGMLPKMNILRPKRATPVQMTAFHTDEYVQFLHKVTPETAESLTHNNSRFLLLDDNPAFEGLFEFCSISAGGSIAAASQITSNSADIAINWSGGLHHAKKREASGFCYINDIVLCILELLRSYPRVLYIDIDVHHGDGVEEAFYSSDRVMTCSFHKYGEFFPGTGALHDRGEGRGKGYAVNVPLNDGCGDETFGNVFDTVIDRILERFRPEAIVLQCGSDSLAGDKLGPFNMTHLGHSHCVQFIRSKNIPLILVGGGGYTVKNASRAWAYETACALGTEKDIDPALPWNDYFEWFGPRYRLEVLPTNAVDENTEKHVEYVIEEIFNTLDELTPVPSVELQDVPRESVDEHLRLNFSSSKNGPRSYGDEWRRDMYGTEANDELDDSLARETLRVYQAQLPKPRSVSPESDHPMSDLTESTSSDDSPNAIARRRKRHQRQRERGRAKKSKKRMSIVANAWKEVSVKEPVNPVGWYEGADVDEKERARAPRYFRSEVGWYKDQGMVLSSEKWRKTLDGSYIPQEDDDDEEEEGDEDDEDEEEEGGEEDEEEEEEGEVDEDPMQEDEDEEEGEIVKMEED